MFIAYAEHANSRGKCLWLTVNQAWLAGLWKTVEGKRKKICAHRSLSNAHNWIVRIPWKKARRRRVCISNARSNTTAAATIHSYVYVYNIYYILFYIIHTIARAVRLHTRRVPRTPQHASNDFARGSFELFPKAIGTDVFICNSYWKLFTKNIREPACIRYTAVVYILVFSMCATERCRVSVPANVFVYYYFLAMPIIDSASTNIKMYNFQTTFLSRY